jgi:hypothetical protein
MQKNAGSGGRRRMPARKKKVIQSEEIPIPRTTVQGLLESVRTAFGGDHKVTRLTYSQGKSALTVERLVPEDQVAQPEDGDFLTPYQMIRQHADLTVQEPVDDGLLALSKAVQQLTLEGYRLTMFVCPDRELVRRWIGNGLRIDHVWQVPLYEDPDAQEFGIFVVGSSRGSLVRDIEAAVFCRTGG